MAPICMNRVSIIGRLGRDPDIREMKDGRKFATFSIATTESYTDKSGKREEKTEWHNVIVFNALLVKTVQNSVCKGAFVMLEGKLSTNKYTDKAGITKYSTQIVLSSIDSVLHVISDAKIQGTTELGSTNNTDDDYSIFLENKANEHSYEELRNKSAKRESPLKTYDTTFDDSDLIPF
jgi:single-strand DNA-binding protein